MAAKLLTGLPTPRLASHGPEALVGSLLWFPVVGALVGAATGVAELGVRTLTGDHAAACAMALAVGLLVTRGGHVRGLMVMLGALFAGRDAAGIAELATRRWPTGSGVLAGAVALLLRYALLLALPGHTRLAALLLAGALSRATIVWVAWRFPYAPVDTGVAGYLATLAGARDLLLALPLLAVGFGTLDPLWVLGALGAAWALPHLFAWWISQPLQGVNANTYDAVPELGDVSALGAMAACAYLESIGAL